MTEKHIADLDEVARSIYNYAANQITAFIEREYGAKPDGPLDNQLEDFHLIAERASIYLMGNALAIMDEEAEEESILVQNKHLRSMIRTIRNMAQTTNGPLN